MTSPLKGKPMSEDDLLRAVLDLAKLYNWRSFHARPAMTAKGYRTAVSGDGKGFPDLIMVKGADLLAIELKRDGGKATVEQQMWLAAFDLVARESTVWRPADWRSGEILRVLSS
jgi:hypothetical protein